MAKYWARLRQLRQRRDALEAALAAADFESGLPSRQQAEDALDDGGEGREAKGRGWMWGGIRGAGAVGRPRQGQQCQVNIATERAC